MSTENISKERGLEKEYKNYDNLSLSNFFYNKDEYVFVSTNKKFKKIRGALRMYDFMGSLERIFMFFENEWYWDVEEGLKLKFFLTNEEIQQLLNEDSEILWTKSAEILDELNYFKK